MPLVAVLFSALALAVNPVSVTGSAESITTGSAALTGTVNPGGEATTYHFEYGTTDAYGLVTPDQNLVAGSDPVDVRATISGLTSNTTYHYRVVATNASGSHAGADRTLRTATPAAAPSVSSRAATGVGGTGATLVAAVTPRSLATSVRFEYGTSTSYGTSTPEQAIGAGGSAVTVRAVVAGLRPNTRYNFRAVATSAAGVTRGSQSHVHDRAGADRHRRHALHGAPDLGQHRDLHGHGQRLRHHAGRAGEAGLPLQRTLDPGRDRDLELERGVHAALARIVHHRPSAHGHAHRRGRGVGVTTANVAVKVGLKTQRVSSRRIRLTGATWPDVPAGRASLQRQSRSGRWGPVARTSLSPLPGGRSRYSFVVSKRSRAMNYRVVVVPETAARMCRATPARRPFRRVAERLNG